MIKNIIVAVLFIGLWVALSVWWLRIFDADVFVKLLALAGGILLVSYILGYFLGGALNRPLHKAAFIIQLVIASSFSIFWIWKTYERVKHFGKIELEDCVEYNRNMIKGAAQEMAYEQIRRRVNGKVKYDSDSIFCLYKIVERAIDTTIDSKHYKQEVQFIYRLKYKRMEYYAAYYCNGTNCMQIVDTPSIKVPETRAAMLRK